MDHSHPLATNVVLNKQAAQVEVKQPQPSSHAPIYRNKAGQRERERDSHQMTFNGPVCGVWIVYEMGEEWMSGWVELQPDCLLSDGFICLPAK